MSTPRQDQPAAPADLQPTWGGRAGAPRRFTALADLQPQPIYSRFTALGRAASTGRSPHFGCCVTAHRHRAEIAGGLPEPRSRQGVFGKDGSAHGDRRRGARGHHARPAVSVVAVDHRHRHQVLLGRAGRGGRGGGTIRGPAHVQPSVTSTVVAVGISLRCRTARVPATRHCT